MQEIANDVVRVICRMPDKSQLGDDIRFHQLTWQVREQREAEARALEEASAADPHFDPLIHKLRELSALKGQLDQHIRHLLTYGRNFVRPRPYQLAVLAEATGLSVSGVRLICQNEEINHEVARNIDKPDISGKFSSPPADPNALVPGDYAPMIAQLLATGEQG